MEMPWLSMRFGTTRAGRDFVFSSAFPQARDDSRLMLAQLAKQIRIALAPDRDNKPPILDGEPEAVLPGIMDKRAGIVRFGFPQVRKAGGTFFARLECRKDFGLLAAQL